MYETPTAPAPVTARDIIRILRRHAALAFFTFVVVVAATLYLTAHMPKMYEAQTSLLLDSVAPASVSNGLSGGLVELLSGGNGGTPLDTEIQKIMSRNFLREVIERGNLGEVTNLDDIHGRLNVTAGTGNQILLISASANTAKTAMDMANWTAKVYMDRVQREFNDKTELSKGRLRKAEDQALVEKQASEKALDDFMARVGLSDPGVLFNAQTAKTMDVRNALDDARRNITLQQAQLALYEKQLKTIPPMIVGGYGLDKNPVIDGYNADIAALEAQRRVLLFDYKPDSDEVQSIDLQIKAKQMAIDDAKKSPYSVGAKSIGRNPDYAQAQTSFYNTAFGIRATQKLIASKEAQLATLESEQKGLSRERTQYEDLRRARDSASDAYEKARLSLLQMDLSRVTSAPNIRVMDPAELPKHPTSPKPVLNFILSIALGIILSVGMALLKEYYRAGEELPESNGEEPHTVPSIEGLPHVGGVPLLGAVPVTSLPSSMFYTAPTLRGAEHGLIPMQSASIEDALREVGYSLAHRHPGVRPPVVVLMGTRSDDSTAALTSHLAATLIREGLRVTLVDADRGNPRLNQVFGKPDAPGMAELLADPKLDPRSVLHAGSDGNLRFLSAGSPQNTVPSEPEGLRRIFDSLASPDDTDLVLISGPTIWGVRMALPLEQAADGMVLIAPHDAPPAESVARARRLLSNGYKPRILGVVVGQESGVPPVIFSHGTPAVVKEEKPE